MHSKSSRASRSNYWVLFSLLLVGCSPCDDYTNLKRSYITDGVPIKYSDLTLNDIEIGYNSNGARFLSALGGSNISYAFQARDRGTDYILNKLACLLSGEVVDVNGYTEDGYFISNSLNYFLIDYGYLIGKNVRLDPYVTGTADFYNQVLFLAYSLFVASIYEFYQGRQSVAYDNMLYLIELGVMLDKQDAAWLEGRICLLFSYVFFDYWGIDGWEGEGVADKIIGAYRKYNPLSTARRHYYARRIEVIDGYEMGYRSNDKATNAGWIIKKYSSGAAGPLMSSDKIECHCLYLYLKELDREERYINLYETRGVIGNGILSSDSIKEMAEGSVNMTQLLYTERSMIYTEMLNELLIFEKSKVLSKAIELGKVADKDVERGEIITKGNCKKLEQYASIDGDESFIMLLTYYYRSVELGSVKKFCAMPLPSI